jgi:hypothetical protein
MADEETVPEIDWGGYPIASDFEFMQLSDFPGHLRMTFKTTNGDCHYAQYGDEGSRVFGGNPAATEPASAETTARHARRIAT